MNVRRLGRLGFNAYCAFAFFFLVAPILVIIPLSFNAEPYFTFTEGMLRFDADAYSLRWYETLVEDGQWGLALANSLIIGAAATVLATVLGTLAALGLASPAMPGRTLIMSILISPMVTPVIIIAVGVFFFYSSIGLAQSHIGLILAHTALGAPFVVITVTATRSRQGFSRAVFSRSQPPSMRSSSCCSWAASSNAQSRARCGLAFASRSVRHCLRWRCS